MTAPDTPEAVAAMVTRLRYAAYCKLQGNMAWWLQPKENPTDFGDSLKDAAAMLTRLQDAGKKE